MSWERKTLDKLGIISRGRSKHRPRNDSTLFGGRYPFIQTADVKNANFYLTEYSQTYNEKGLAQSKLWPKGTLCITIAANIADTAILGIEACFPDSIMGFLPHDGISDVRFIKYCFDILQKECRQISQGTAQDNLSWEKLSTITFPAPSYQEQKKVADLLSAYDDLIENNNKQIKLLEEAAQRLYKEWFVDLRFPGHETTNIVDGVPEGWEKVSFSSKVSIMSGGTPKTTNKSFYNGTIPFYTPKDHSDNFFVFDTALHISHAGLSNCNSDYYPEGTIIITARGTVGKTVLLGVPMAMNQSCYALKSDSLCTPYYLFFSLNQEVAKLKTMANGGVFDTIIVKTFDSIHIAIPGNNLHKKFEYLVTGIMEKIKKLLQQNEALRTARSLLLPRLMKGQCA